MSLESIALIPSGYKANKLYCQLPVDGGADLTTSRASSATRVNKNGLVEDVATGVPRLDYTNGSCPELLLEPQRRNLIPYSEDFTQPDWTSGSTATLSASTTLAPDGSLNAVKVTATANDQDLRDVVTVTSGQTYTVSFWVRRVTGSGVISIVGIELATTPIAVTSEWQRFSVTATATSTSGRAYVRLATAGDEIEVWGAQLEDNGTLGGGDYMTSYIRTSGTAVTRIADAVSGNSSLGSVINSSEGVFYAEISALADSGGNRRFSLSDGTNTNRVVISYSSTTNQIQCFIVVGGSAYTPSFIVSDVTDLNKVALKWKANDFALWVNGVERDTHTLIGTFTSSTLTQLKFEDGSGANPFYGRVKELKVYDTALTDAQLTELTS